MSNDAKWRQRLLAYSAVRAGGVALFLFGIAIFYTNVLKPGGWPQLGAIVAILGALDAVIAPRLLKRAWDKQDSGQQ